MTVLEFSVFVLFVFVNDWAYFCWAFSFFSFKYESVVFTSSRRRCWTNVRDIMRLLKHYVLVSKCLLKSKYKHNPNQTMLIKFSGLRGHLVKPIKGGLNLFVRLYWTFMKRQPYVAPNRNKTSIYVLVKYTWNFCENYLVKSKLLLESLKIKTTLQQIFELVIQKRNPTCSVERFLL